MKGSGMKATRNVRQWLGSLVQSWLPQAEIANRTNGITAGRASKLSWRTPGRGRYNPLPGLTLERAQALLDAYQRGEMVDLQWAYYFIEGADPDLLALVERRCAALLEMAWHIKRLDPDMPQSRIISPVAPKVDRQLAAEQADALRNGYEQIDNLYEAIEHLSSATFRGFAHLEKHRDDRGAVCRLEPLDQWNACPRWIARTLEV